MAFGCRPMWIISGKKETQPSHTIFPVKSQKVVASIFKIWTGLTCEGSSCRVWVIDRWQKLEIDQSIFLFFKVLIVPLQTTWDGCYVKQILSKGSPWEGSTYLIRWSTIKTPPSFKMNQKHQSPWTVLEHILKVWADLNSTVTKISSTLEDFTHNLTVPGFQVPVQETLTAALLSKQLELFSSIFWC